MQVAALSLCSSQHNNTASPVLFSYFYIRDFCGKIFTLCLLKGGFSTHKGSFVLPASWKDFNCLCSRSMMKLLAVMVMRLVGGNLLAFAADTVLRRTR